MTKKQQPHPTFEISDSIPVRVLEGPGVDLVDRGDVPPAQARRGQRDDGDGDRHQRQSAAHYQPEQDLSGHPVPSPGGVQQQHLLGHPGVRFDLRVLVRSRAQLHRGGVAPLPGARAGGVRRRPAVDCVLITRVSDGFLQLHLTAVLFKTHLDISVNSRIFFSFFFFT